MVSSLTDVGLMRRGTLIAGHTTHDRYETRFVAGGCAFYGARTHHYLTKEFAPHRPTPHLLTLVGEDFQCQEALQGLDFELLQLGVTTVFSNLYPSDGPRQQLVEALAGPVDPDSLSRPIETFDLIHLAPVLGEVDLQGWVRKKSSSAFLAINVQGWIKAPESQGSDSSPPKRVVQVPWEVTLRELHGVDLACLSDEDLIGQGDLLERLRSTVPFVAHTHGEEGATIYTPQGSFQVGIFKTEAIDPTGAGDVFAATLAHFLLTSSSPEEAARYASAASSIVVEGQGPSALGRLKELKDRAGKIPIYR